MIVVVTAFVPIPGHPRSETQYHELARPLMSLTGRVPLMFAQGDLERCWLHGYLNRRFGLNTANFSYSIGDNPHKNSLAYHMVQAQKTEWLVAASTVDPVADVFCWIDYGIFHLPGMTIGIIEEFLKRADSEQAIAIPGCWEKDQYPYVDNYPYWRFCGGVMVVPRQYVVALDMAMKTEYERWLYITENVSWEVNTLARVEQQNPELPIWWYKADHDKTLFTNYKATEHADGRHGPSLVAKNEKHERAV
jgi:hypothetical protein